MIRVPFRDYETSGGQRIDTTMSGRGKEVRRERPLAEEVPKDQPFLFL